MRKTPWISIVFILLCGSTAAVTPPQLISPQSPLSLSGSTLSIPQATSVQDGFLDAADWITFNGKQAAGNYITTLTGDVSASGPGAASATISASTVTGKALTGFTAGAGTVSASDTILEAFQKLWGWVSNLFSDYTQLVVEEVSDGTLPFLSYAPYKMDIVDVRAKCGSGTVTFSLEVDGVGVTDCDSFAVDSDMDVATCNGVINANSRGTFTFSSNSSCVDFEATIKTTRML